MFNNNKLIGFMEYYLNLSPDHWRGELIRGLLIRGGIFNYLKEILSDAGI